MKEREMVFLLEEESAKAMLESRRLRIAHHTLKAFLLFLLLSGSSHADDVLTQITARLVKTPITQGNFQQEKRLKILRKPLVSTGTFTYHQSKGVIWKTLTPVVSLLLVNKSRLLTAQGEQAVPAALPTRKSKFHFRM